MRVHFLVSTIALLLFNTAASAECLSLRGRTIVSRISPGAYEFFILEPRPFCDMFNNIRTNCRMLPGESAILKTNGDKFASAGMITTQLFVNAEPSKVKVKLKNGFDSEMFVYTESEECMSSYENKRKKQEAEDKVREEAERVRQKKIDEENAKKEREYQKKQKIKQAEDEKRQQEAEALWE